MARLWMVSVWSSPRPLMSQLNYWPDLSVASCPGLVESDPLDGKNAMHMVPSTTRTGVSGSQEWTFLSPTSRRCIPRSPPIKLLYPGHRFCCSNPWHRLVGMGSPRTRPLQPPTGKAQRAYETRLVWPSKSTAVLIISRKNCRIRWPSTLSNPSKTTAPAA